MKEVQTIEFSEHILKDMKMISKYNEVNFLEWQNRLSHNFNLFIQEKKDITMKQIEGDWLLGRMKDSEYKKLTGEKVPKILKEEKAILQRDSVLYKENARKALLMNIQI